MLLWWYICASMVVCMCFYGGIYVLLWWYVCASMVVCMCFYGGMYVLLWWHVCASMVAWDFAIFVLADAIKKQSHPIDVVKFWHLLTNQVKKRIVLTLCFEPSFMQNSSTFDSFYLFFKPTIFWRCG